MADPQATPEQQAAAEAQAAADAAAREQAGAPPSKADAKATPKAAKADAKATPKAAKADAKAASYDVLHGAVGEWPQGTVITADDLKAANVDERGVQRLLDLEAIAPHQDKE